jgi:cell division septum initiation protein DivIVA
VNDLTNGEAMLGFKGTSDEDATSPLAENAPVAGDAMATEPNAPTTVSGGSTSPARLLEVAAMTADKLVADAKTEAESLVSAARAEADAIAAASRTEAQQTAAELARAKEQQTADLSRERATALAGLAAEKASLEEQITTLRRLQSDHREEMRDHLKKQLSLLDATTPVRPSDVLG